jgi:hypothetical protein
MARWNNPLESGEVIRKLTSNAPPDSPKIVTVVASPPNLAIFVRTHRSAAIWSRMP